METTEASRLAKLDRELGEVIARINHLPTNDTITAVRREHQDQTFRTLQEVGGLIGNMRSDVKDWLGTARDQSRLELEAAKAEIMSAIKADRSWIKQLPIYAAIVLGILGILTGNPHLAKIFAGAM